MFLNPFQINQLLQIIDTYMVRFASSTITDKYLTDAEKKLLDKYGIKVNKTDFTVNTAFKYGMLSEALGNDKARGMSFNQLKKYLQSKSFLPLDQREQRVLDSLEHQAYHEIRGLGNRMKDNFNRILIETDSKQREAYENVIKEAAKKTVADRGSLKEMSSLIGNATQDWARDLDRISDYILHDAHDHGRAAQIQRNLGVDAKVYKHVFSSACKHCVRLYFTNGWGSQPKVFTIEELLKNGNNIGRKVADWKPVLGPTHPWSITDKTTSILTDTGYKMIKDIEVGDMVLTHKGRFRKVLSTLKDYPCPYTEKDHKHTYSIYYKYENPKDPDNISKISFTGDHKILTQRGWVMVKDVTEKDKMIKLMKKCVVCNGYMEQSVKSKRVCCSEECSRKYRAINAHNKWKNEELTEQKKKKISEKVKQNWKEGKHENTLKNLKFEETDIVFIKRNFSSKNTKLYDIEVEEDESFVARGVVVHNCRCETESVPPNAKWNEETGRFEMQLTDKEKEMRKKVKVKMRIS